MAFQWMERMVSSGGRPYADGPVGIAEQRAASLPVTEGVLGGQVKVGQGEDFRVYGNLIALLADAPQLVDAEGVARFHHRRSDGIVPPPAQLEMVMPLHFPAAGQGDKVSEQRAVLAV